MGGFSAIGISPADIWNYSTRRLTERFTVIERGKGYTSGVSIVLDETRYFNTLVLLGSGRGAIVIYPNEDIAPSKSWTVITSPSTGTAPACVTDRDDSTYCEWFVGASVEIGVLMLDLGSPMRGFLRVVHLSAGGAYTRVYVSNDASTWTKIFDTSTAGNVNTNIIYVDGYRYIKFSFYNSSTTTSATCRLYTVMFFIDSALPFTRSLNSSTRVVCYVYNAYYQLLEVIAV